MLGPSLRIKNTPTLDIYPLYGKVKFVINAFMKNYWENLKNLKKLIFTNSFKPKPLYLLEFYEKFLMLGTFANLKILMKCHRLGAFHMTFYSGDMVPEMKTQTCLFT